MIIGYIGDIGSGKTLSMTRYILNAIKETPKKKIYTNYHLSGGLKYTILDKQFFNDFTKSKFKLFDCIVALDEAQVFIDSRNSMSMRNKIFSRFITQSRHRGVDFIYTTQDVNPLSFKSSGQVELRLRKLTDRIVLCSCKRSKGRLIVINEIYNNSGRCLKRYFFDAETIFQYYDTYEIIDFIDDD